MTDPVNPLQAAYSERRAARREGVDRWLASGRPPWLMIKGPGERGWVGKLLALAATREPDFIVGREDDPYLLRWWLIPRNRLFNVYLHLFLRSDDDRALHDHPWVNLSILLRGAYVEHSIRGGVQVRRRREAGEIKLRAPWAAHRIELTDGPCWTLFITGPKVRSWGFHCPGGWVDWKVFTAPDNRGAVGRGCGE